ncbi:hypothetical protein PO002_32535 [Cupriavidus necator]|uniref:hypothetical protein n=1 Tax=Cupriavidus necator TaxID=106590 RepID=UPI0039C37B44
MKYVGSEVFPGFHMVQTAAASDFETSDLTAPEAVYEIPLVPEGGGAMKSSVGAAVQTIALDPNAQSDWDEGMAGNAPARRGNDMATSTEHQSGASAASEQAHAVLRDVERRWDAAAREWNVDALTSMYAPEALFFGGRPGHAVGQPEILAYCSYAGTLLSASMSLDTRNSASCSRMDARPSPN